jgi:hypothetical protein
VTYGRVLLCVELFNEFRDIQKHLQSSKVRDHERSQIRAMNKETKGEGGRSCKIIGYQSSARVLTIIILTISFKCDFERLDPMGALFVWLI